MHSNSSSSSGLRTLVSQKLASDVNTIFEADVGRCYILQILSVLMAVGKSRLPAKLIPEHGRKSRKMQRLPFRISPFPESPPPPLLHRTGMQLRVSRKGKQTRTGRTDMRLLRLSLLRSPCLTRWIHWNTQRLPPSPRRLLETMLRLRIPLFRLLWNLLRSVEARETSYPSRR